MEAVTRPMTVTAQKKMKKSFDTKRTWSDYVHWSYKFGS
jgi:hypothetical protein